VTPDGRGSYDTGGTQEDPWYLDMALRHPPQVRPGDTIWVRGGTYHGAFLSRIKGTAEKPIIVRAWPGERVILDGTFETTLTQDLPAGTAYSGNFDVADASGLPIGGNRNIAIYDPDRRDETFERFRIATRTETRVWASRAASCTDPEKCFHRAGSIVKPGTGSFLQADGAYTWFWGLEIMASQPTHVIGEGHNPPWPEQSDGILDQCDGCKFINLIVHDSGSNGIFSGAPGKGTEIYGSLVFYNGIDQLTARPHGHGVYAQNLRDGRTKSLIDNFFFRSFYHGNQIYGTGAAFLDNFVVEGNTYFNAAEPGKARSVTQFIIGDAGVFNGHVFRDNMVYGAGVDIGYGGKAASPECISPVITGNYIATPTPGAPALKVTCLNPVISGNTVLGRPVDFTRQSFPDNEFFSGPPGGLKIFVRPNKYEPGRANIIVFNWNNEETASVDVSGSGLEVGQWYEVRDVQDFWGAPVATGIYQGEPIRIPLTNTQVAQPIGAITSETIQHTPREFNAFVLLRSSERPAEKPPEPIEEPGPTPETNP
jgi:hypothetical protein